MLITIEVWANFNIICYYYNPFQSEIKNLFDIIVRILTTLVVINAFENVHQNYKKKAKLTML